MRSFNALEAAAVGVPAAIVGAVVGYLLNDRAHRRQQNQSRRREQSETAEALLKELSQIAQVLGQRFPQFIASTQYWTPFPRLPLVMYLELEGQGRVVRLGVPVASDVHTLYSDVEQINRSLTEVEATISDHPEISRSVDFLDANAGDKWHEVWLRRRRIEQKLEMIRPQLMALIPAPSET